MVRAFATLLLYCPKRK